MIFLKSQIARKSMRNMQHKYYFKQIIKTLRRYFAYEISKDEKE